MSDEVWRRAEADSPCVKICVLHPGAKICVGCYRTGEEIAGWMRLTAEERQNVLDALPGRADRLRDPAARPSRRRARRERSE